MKFNIEIAIHEGGTWLNFWNAYNGDDVIAELRNGKLYIEDKEVSISEYVDLLKDRMDFIIKDSQL